MSTPVEHSDFGPSQWHRLLRCPAALSEEKNFPDDAGYEAAQGTVFHEIVSDCLELGLRPEHWLGHVFTENGFTIEVDREMIDSCEQGIDYIEHFREDRNCQILVEKRVDISPWVGEGQFGTSDVAIVNVPERWIIQFDWKYGMEPVYAEENDQLYGYSLGFWNTHGKRLFDDDPSGIKVTFVIEQPRVPGAGGRWETTMARVLEFGEFAKRQAFKARAKNPPFVPGVKQCRWCRARPQCGAHAEYVLEVLGSKFDDIDDALAAGNEIRLPKELTPERRSFILKNRPLITRFLETLHASAYNDARIGNPTPGFALFDGRRPARQWRENSIHKVEARLERMLGRKPYRETLLTPAQVEAEVGKKVFADSTVAQFVEQGDPKPILGDAKDTREPKESARDRLARYLDDEESLI